MSGGFQEGGDTACLPEKKFLFFSNNSELITNSDMKI